MLHFYTFDVCIELSNLNTLVFDRLHQHSSAAQVVVVCLRPGWQQIGCAPTVWGTSCNMAPLERIISCNKTSKLFKDVESLPPTGFVSDLS